jgi:hypothetical protein
MPSFLANRISLTGITKLFAALRKQVKDPKYAFSTPEGARLRTGLGGTPNGKSVQALMANGEGNKKPE